MTWQELGGISEVFYTYDRMFGIQRVGNCWSLYGHDGSFIKGFPSFASMIQFIIDERMKMHDKH